MSSSRRYKKEIQPINKGSKAILGLKPVTFHYKSDKANRPEFGLIAEQVAEVNPDLVVRDKKGEIYTVRYDAVNAMLVAEDVEAVDPDLVVRDNNGEIYTMRHDAVNAILLNEFLKAHRKMEEQQVTITQLKKDLQATASHHQEQIEELTEGLQKVSAQLAAASPSQGGLQVSKFATGRIRRGGPAPQTVLNNQ